MAPQAVPASVNSEQPTPLSLSQAEETRDQTLADLRASPDNPELWLTLMRAQMALRDTPALAKTAEVVADLPRTPASLDLLIAYALDIGNLREARRLVSVAEADATLPDWSVARGKARIALAQGDLDAALAILVAAIEAEPDVPQLRTVLTEALIASGGAGHARDVQSHLGLPPVNTPADTEGAPKQDRAQG